MITDKYITKEELFEVARIIEVLDAAFRSLDSLKTLSINVLTEEDGSGRTFPIYDCTGEVVGHIGWGDTGYALYGDNGE